MHSAVQQFNIACTCHDTHLVAKTSCFHFLVIFSRQCQPLKETDVWQFSDCSFANLCQQNKVDTKNLYLLQNSVFPQDITQLYLALVMSCNIYALKYKIYLQNNSTSSGLRGVHRISQQDPWNKTVEKVFSKHSSFISAAGQWHGEEKLCFLMYLSL